MTPTGADEALEYRMVRLLAGAGKTLAVAASCTGGLIERHLMG